jgi:hypothetical protein
MNCVQAVPLPERRLVENDVLQIAAELPIAGTGSTRW